MMLGIMLLESAKELKGLTLTKKRRARSTSLESAKELKVGPRNPSCSSGLQGLESAKELKEGYVAEPRPRRHPPLESAKELKVIILFMPPLFLTSLESAKELKEVYDGTNWVGKTPNSNPQRN